jgi:hypothetical protein
MGWKDRFWAGKKNVGSSRTYFPTFGKAAVGARNSATRVMAGGAAAGTRVVKVVASGTKEHVKKAAGNAGFVLFLAASIIFLITKIAGVPDIYGYLSFFMMLYSVLAVFDKKGLFVIILFTIWYFWFGAADFSSIRFWGIPLLLCAFVLHGAFTGFTSSKENRSENVKAALMGELFVGVGHVVIFFLDVGILQLKEVSLPGFLTAVLAWIPLWAYVGLFMMASDKEHRTVVTSIMQIVGIAYLVSVLLLVPSELGKADAGPGVGTIVSDSIAARQEETTVAGENPAWSNAVCAVTEPTAMPECFQRRQDLALFTGMCKKEGHKENTPEFTECIDEQKEKRKNAAVAVSGVNDPNIKKPTKAKFIVDEYFPKETFRRAGEDTQTLYPINLEIENPRNEVFSAIISCSFKKSSDKEATFGEIVGPNTFDVDEEFMTKTFICRPINRLNGSYSIEFFAEMQGLNTGSRLMKAFIGQKDSIWKKEWLPKIKSAHFSGSQHLSQGPADFARLNFGFGNSLSNPIVEGSTNLILSATVENVADGRITKIHNYDIILDGFSVEPTCLYGDSIDLPSEKVQTKKVYLPAYPCLIQSIPPELQNPEEYVLKEFEGTLNYDYKISKKESITIKEVEALR